MGAGTGNEFSNTAELKPMKYKAAMKCDDKELWIQAVEEEYNKFVKYGVFKAVKKGDVPKNAKFVSTTWAMKRKSNGVRRARLNMRGYEQVAVKSGMQKIVALSVTEAEVIAIVSVSKK